TYVISGDELNVSESCGDWSFVEYKGKRKTTSGWVISDSVPSNLKEPATEYAESIPMSKVSVCREVEEKLNSALQSGNDAITGLPSALTNPSPLSKDNTQISAADSTVFDVNIQGNKLKAVAYDSRGTCTLSYLELWYPDFKKRIPIGGSNADMEQAWAEGDSLVSLQRNTYFVHNVRGKNFSLARFNEDLSTSKLCSISEYPAHKQVATFVADAAVCDAVLAGHINGVPLAEVESPEFSGDSKDEKNDDPFAYRRGWQVVSRGNLDIDNDGKVDDVGMVAWSEASGAGCGHEYAVTQPIKLNPDGTADRNSQFNKLVFKTIDKSDFGARVFQFKGKTYVEYLSGDNADELPFHEVWKYSPESAEKICSYMPVRFRAKDLNTNIVP
ncbi:MAG: hypothetical protein ABUL58_00895, partial [Steroidobacter sp.]